MSAIETCRTAALGGHVEACEGCPPHPRRLQLLPQPALPQCQGAAAREWLAAREADLLPVGYFHVVFTVPVEIADIAFTNKAPVYDLLFRAASGNLADDRRRPAPPQRPHRHYGRPPHLRLGADRPSARPYDRARRRDLARRHARDVFAAGLPVARPRARQAVPPAVPHGTVSRSMPRAGSASSVTGQG